MSEDERRRWDERYTTGDYLPRTEPSPFVVSALEVIPPGRALVLACGAGRNAIRLAEAGFRVEAVDISQVAIDQGRVEAERRGVDVTWRVADLDTLDPDVDTYDLITTIRYVNRRLWPRLVPALTPDGWLLMEQHLRTRIEVRGPGDDFRVGSGELLEAFASLRVVEYSERLERSDRDGELPAALARLLACKGNPGW